MCGWVMHLYYLSSVIHPLSIFFDTSFLSEYKSENKNNPTKVY